MKKLKLILSLIISSFLFMSCGNNHDFEITFNSPEADALVPAAEAENLEINVSFSSDHELHEIEVKLYPSNSPDDHIIDYDGHDHAEAYTFVQQVDLSSYEPATMFTLEAVVCEDHDCQENYTQKINFSIE